MSSVGMEIWGTRNVQKKQRELKNKYKHIRENYREKRGRGTEYRESEITSDLTRSNFLVTSFIISIKHTLSRLTLTLNQPSL
jgi:hypothetical protein